MSLNSLAIADLLSFSQGLLLGVLFLSNSKGNRHANNLLGLFLLLFNFGSLHSFFLNSGLVNQYNWLLGFPSLFLLWFGPLLYFYSKSLSINNFTWKRSYNWWFVPAAVELLGNFILLSLGTEQLFKLAYNEYFIWGAALHSFAASLFSIYFTVRSLILIKSSASLSALKQKWLKYILSYFMGRFVFWSLYFALVLAQASHVIKYTPEVISLLTLMDFIAVFAISIFSFKHMHEIHTSQKEAAYILSPEQETLYFNSLLRLLQQERLYRKSDLKLSEVASLLQTNVKYVSQLIKLRTGHSFTSFINTYRIDEFKNRILDEQFRHLTIIAIAEECGFNSKATFNRVFKEMEGISPKVYREKHTKQVC
ncbi:helix-turn-helix domain-containing protein [Pontibacter sp. MBLB2868]|uniref:helix-turn-helix domain-containing protein n=1 Tax=Pontibacter sp. MBLB2868 TaxID=3451555 RepID=UPI003F7554D0